MKVIGLTDEHKQLYFMSLGCTPRSGSWNRRLLGWIFRGFQLWLLQLTRKTVARKRSFVRYGLVPGNWGKERGQPVEPRGDHP